MDMPMHSDSPGAVTKPGVKSGLMGLEPEVALVTKALRQIPLHDKTRATLESCRVFRVFSMKKFQAALSDAVQAEADAFAEALEGSAGYFSEKQLDQIMSWTGLTIVAPPRDDDLFAKDDMDDDAAADDDQDDLGGATLDEQLAQLQEEVENPEAARKRRRLEAVKKEAMDEVADKVVARARPNWQGRATPEAPAVAAARQWVASRAGLGQQFNQYGRGHGGKGGKGGGKSGPRQKHEEKKPIVKEEAGEHEDEDGEQQPDYGALAAVAKPTESGMIGLEPNVAVVTKVLRQLPLHNKTRAKLESCRVFRVFSMKKFRAALSDAKQAEADAFAEALEGSAGYFSENQLDQIRSWTGLTIVAPPSDGDLFAKEEADEDAGAEDEQDDLGGATLDEQLAQLQEEVENPEAARKRRKAEAAKAAMDEAADKAIARTRPDWKGRAAPETPAAATAARQWVASRAGFRQQFNQYGRGKGGKGGKGWGKSGPRQWRSWGIASLDTSARLHGNSMGGYEFRQMAAHGDRENKFLIKEESGEQEDEEGEQQPKKRGLAAPPRLPKGTPTLAPMCPPPGEVEL